MGKFINTRYKDSVDSLVTLHKDLIQNPFYLFNDKKGTKVKYYNINMEKSTLDPGSKLAYTDLGLESPIRYNVINDLFLYQFNRIELNLENGDYGLEGNEITGESYILPNTITPTENDFFEVDHIEDSTWLFKVTDVQRDTLENGANIFKITWCLDRTTNKEILNNIVDEFKYLDVQEGTNIKSVVQLDRYKMAEKLDNCTTTLREYFKELFYSDKVQTFIYLLYSNSNMYDPFSIEFIIRNEVLNSSEKYIYIEHKTNPSHTFSIDYNKTFFRAFEERDISVLKSSVYQSQAKIINDVTSIFSTRYEDYFCLDYKVYMQENNIFNPRGIINILSDDFIDHIVSNKSYEEKNEKFKNIFVKYFNNQDLFESDIESISYIDFEYTWEIYYYTLLLIFCIDFYTKMLLS